MCVNGMRIRPIRLSWREFETVVGNQVIGRLEQPITVSLHFPENPDDLKKGDR
jgi:hypothetical protein